jgi:hypothetical protein
MAFNYSPKIITNGLVLYLDAANPKSYLSGSTKWNDLTKTRAIGSLINGLTFDSGSLGSIVFDGVDDYANLGVNPSCYSPSGFTIDAWVKFLISPTQANPILSIYTGTGYEYVFGSSGNYLYGWVYDQLNNAYRGRRAPLTPSSGTWQNLTMIYDGGIIPTSVRLYLNGIQFDNTNFSGGGTFASIKNSSTPMIIAQSNGGLGGPSKGNIANLKFYNRVLTVTEIQQNFNAMKSRFNL